MWWLFDLLGSTLLRSCFRLRPEDLGYVAANWIVAVLHEHLERRTCLWMTRNCVPFAE